MSLNLQVLFESTFEEFPAHNREPYKVRTTTALIKASGEPIIIGKVRQFSGDQDNIALGQKYALTKALKSKMLSKDIKIQIWKDFFNRSKSTRRLINHEK